MKKYVKAAQFCTLGLVILATTPTSAYSQTPVCINLRAQLERLQTNGGGGARSADFARVDRLLQRKQNSLDKANAQYYRMKCQQTGFLIFGKRKHNSCRPLDRQIQQLQREVRNLETRRRQLSGGGGSVSSAEMRRVVAAMQHRKCDGVEGYARVQPKRQRQQQSSTGLFGRLFGTPTRRRTPSAQERIYEPPTEPVRGTYRTMCVRKCDGYYFPISFSTRPGNFYNDAAKCESLCPGSSSDLYVYFNPGERAEDMRHYETEESYQDLDNAFRYRKKYVKSCSCNYTGKTLMSIANSAGGETDGVALLDEDGGIIRTSDDEESFFDDEVVESQVTIKRALLPQPKPPLGEDPDTIANARSGYDPIKALVGRVASKPRTVASANKKRIRIVGPKSFYSQ